MADPPETEEQGTSSQAAPSQPSLVVWLAILVVLTLVAGGAGGGLGVTMGSMASVEPESKKVELEAKEPAVAYSSGEMIKTLPTVVANLAAPADTFVRLEGAIVIAGEPAPDGELLANKISGDILGYLSSLTLAQIEGPSGLQHLREDLSERASMRSEGQVNEVIIHSLVAE